MSMPLRRETPEPEEELSTADGPGADGTRGKTRARGHQCS
jgi:hypothetical protein